MITSRNVIMAYHDGLAAVNERAACGGDNARSLKDNRFLWLSRPSRRTDVSGDHTAKRRPGKGLRFLRMKNRGNDYSRMR